MSERSGWRKVGGLVAVMAGLALAGCGDDPTGAGPPGCYSPVGGDCVNPSTVTLENNLQGPVLFFKVRACGTTDFSEDLLPNDPINGTVQPGTKKDFLLESGCYDLQAEHLETTDPGPLLMKSISDIAVSPVAIFTWALEEVSTGPS